MIVISRFVPLVCILALATSCSGSTARGEQPPPTSTAPSTTVTKPAARTVPRVAKLTAACPLLSAAELKALLGGGTSRTKVTAAEVKPPTSSSHMCKYGSREKKPFELLVDGTSQKRVTPAMELKAIVNNHRNDNTKIRKVTGVGEIANFFIFNDGVSELVASKRSRGQSRMVIFDAPTVVPERKFVDVVKLVIGRI